MRRFGADMSDDAPVRRGARPFASDAEVVAIGTGLLDRTLPKSAWTHEAHFAATVWLILHRPDLDLPRDMPGVIRAYNLATGGENTDTAGYHETITQASLRAARAFVAGAPAAGLAGRSLAVQVNALLASPLGHPDWLLTYWSGPRLFSVEARRMWLEPDLRAPPF